MTKQKWSEGQALLKGRFLTVKGHLSTFGKREICFRQRILLASLELIQLQKEIVSNSRITIDEISPTNIGTELESLFFSKWSNPMKYSDSGHQQAVNHHYTIHISPSNLFSLSLLTRYFGRVFLHIIQHG